jgi:hypothetical protein
MKKTFIMQLFFIIVTGIIYSETPLLDKIWGVWNIGRIENNEDDANIVTVDNNEYARTFDSLIIRKKSKPQPRITYQGGYYNILDYKKKADGVVVFSLSYSGEREINGKWQDAVITGTVAMHFVDDDHAWFEILSGEGTDPDFTKADFQGKERMYWRAKKID